MGELVNLDDVRNKKHFSYLKEHLTNIVFSGSHSNLIYEEIIDIVNDEYVASAAIHYPTDYKVMISVKCYYDTIKRSLFFREIAFPEKSAVFKQEFLRNNMTMEMRELLLLFIGARLIKSFDMLLESKDKDRVLETVLDGIRTTNFEGLFPFREDFSDVIIQTNNTIAQQCVTTDGYAIVTIFHYDIKMGVIKELKCIKFGNHIRQTTIPKSTIVDTENQILIDFAKDRISAALEANKAGPILEI